MKANEWEISRFGRCFIIWTAQLPDLFDAVRFHQLNSNVALNVELGRFRLKLTWDNGVFDWKFFPLPLKWKLQAASVSPEIYFQEFGLPFMVVPIYSVDQEQLLILFIKSRYKMFQECLEGEGDCSGEILKKKA
ncbi:hypothetical protein T07_13823 [Trichinella nelsoni]|uniref:Uncharacterized protein n=1 Tax=Trichinella nelsoni TaxID=6336 RepID=A0A0V0RDF4_9BILA|nr:hypothetical protein T07_7259 [Trichinella nelsoni]KRX12507.1 hypothetical protein T07_13823 [Trichinella nelsoni]